MFNPFTPTPFHNNQELKWSQKDINMFGYFNENHINVKDYPYKLYFDAYDHDNKNGYTYNWISVHGPKH